MAESVNRRISIYIDAVQAEAQLGKLLEREKSLIKANSEIKQGSAAWKANAAEIEKVGKQVAVLNDQLSGKVGPTLDQLKKRQAQLNAELGRMPVELRKGSEAFKQLQTVQNLIGGVTKETKGTAAAWQQFTTQIKAGFVGVLGGNLATAAIGGTVDYVRNAIANAAKVSDQIADIRKTTGLTIDEVNTLNKALGSIDTRTATSELRNMAVVAGQFGIPKEQILGFIKSVDLVNIALGDEFGGGAEAIATEMSKLRNVFTDIKSDDIGMDIRHISNALNELGAAGVATGPVVADFANRIGGVGIQLGLSTAEVLGLSATLQELNVSTERGGTAVTKILQKMLTNIDDFAAIAGMDVHKFSALLNEDLMGAFTAVMEGSSKTGKSSTLLAGIIKDLELNGAGASEVFAKLGKNTDLLKQRVDLANESIIDTNSITEEAAIKQDNLSGSIARLEKQWAKLTTSGNAQGFWQLMVDGASATISGLDSLLATMSGLGGMINKMSDDNAEALAKEFEKRIESEKAELAKQRMLRKQALEKMSQDELAAERQKTAAKQKIAYEGAQIAAKNGNKSGFRDQKEIFNEAKNEIKVINQIIEAKKNQSDAAKQLSAEEKKEAEARLKTISKNLEAFKDFQREVELVSNEAAAAADGNDDKEIERVSTKYAKLLDKAKEHFKKLPQIAEEYLAIVNQLNEAELNDKNAIYDKQIEAAQKAYDKDSEQFLTAEKQKTELLYKETAKRLQDEYNNLIGSKSASLINGQTDGSLNAEEQIDKLKEILLLETQAKVENDQLQAGEREAIWAEYYANIKALDDDFTQNQLNNLFAFADQFSSILQSFSTIEDNKNLKSIQGEERLTKAKLTDVEKRKKSELDALESRNQNGLLKDDTYANSKKSIEEKYAKESRAISENLDLQKAEIARNGAARQKRLAIFSIMLDTAQAIVNMLNVKPPSPANFVMAGMAGIAGAAGIAAVLSQPEPQLNTGGNTLDVVGANTGKTYRSKHIGSFKKGGRYGNASYGIIGEEGAELVIPNWLYTHPKMLDNMRFLEYSISTGKAFAAGGSTLPNSVSTPNYQTTTSDPIMIMTLQKNNQLLSELLVRMQQPAMAVMTYDQQLESTVRMQQIINASGNG